MNFKSIFREFSGKFAMAMLAHTRRGKTSFGCFRHFGRNFLDLAREAATFRFRG